MRLIKGGLLHDLRYRCAASGMHDHDGCSCSDIELLSSEVEKLRRERDEAYERAAKGLRELREAVKSAHADFPNIDRSDLRYFLLLIDAALASGERQIGAGRSITPTATARNAIAPPALSSAPAPFWRSKMDKLTKDERWLLEEAAKPTGFMPNEASVAEFAKRLANRGWLVEDQRHPVWFITDAGRDALASGEGQ